MLNIEKEVLLSLKIRYFISFMSHDIFTRKNPIASENVNLKLSENNFNVAVILYF